MDAIPQTPDWIANDLSLLAYAEHMAATARADAARRLFEQYAELERRRLKASVARQSWPSAARSLNGLGNVG